MKIKRNYKEEKTLKQGSVAIGTASGDYYLICKQNDKYFLVNLTLSKVIVDTYHTLEDLQEDYKFVDIFNPDEVTLGTEG